jgi:radical SAM-linked protein
VGKPVPSGDKPLPAVQHLLVRYAKRGKMRFASHRDVARVFERTVRRADLPVAHSAGFTPHPKISYAGGAPTGVASEAEYLSLALTSRHEAADVRDRLNAALPDGIDVIAVTEDAGGLPASRLTASRWRIVFTDLAPEDVAPAVEKFLTLEHAPVERMTSKGLRRMDARAAVATLDTVSPDPVLPDTADTGISNTGGRGVTLEMVIHHTVPAVRPDDVLTALREVSDLTPSVPPVMTRLEQGSFGESGMVQP